MTDVEMTTTAHEFPVMEPKVAQPEPFNGERKKLKQFLLKCRTYFSCNKSKFQNPVQKVLWVTNLLKGPAYDWVETFVDDFFTNQDNAQPNVLETNGDMNDATVAMFSSWGSFEEAITKHFGDINTEYNARRRLVNMKQTGSCADYVAQFNTQSYHADFDDTALLFHFNEGLKDFIKDELARAVTIDDLDELQARCIDIDNRLYARNMSKKGNYTTRQNFTGNTFRRKGRGQGNRNGYWPQPMDLSSTYEGPSIPKDEYEKRKRNRLCYTCGNAGHMARDCGKKGGKKPAWKGKNNERVGFANATMRGDQPIPSPFVKPGENICCSLFPAGELMDTFVKPEDEDWVDFASLNLTDPVWTQEAESLQVTGGEPEEQTPALDTSEELTRMDVLYVDHPWHKYVPGEEAYCLDDYCIYHLAGKELNGCYNNTRPDDKAIYWTIEEAQKHKERFDNLPKKQHHVERIIQILVYAKTRGRIPQADRHSQEKVNSPLQERRMRQAVPQDIKNSKPWALESRVSLN